MDRRTWSPVLKIPAAGDPAGLLRERGLDTRKATFDLRPYLSLNTSFAQQRDLENAKEFIETRIVRFDTGSSKLVPGEADRIDDVAAEMKRLPGARITITGHADETGSAETNGKLSLERANRVGEALTADGIALAALTITGSGNERPLRQGSTEWDRQVNRSVSFTVSAGPVSNK